MNEERQKVISILRSLIISSPQKGKSLRELARDYHEFEGKTLPTFGYRNLEEFLRASGEFIIELNRSGELIIHERPNEESWHITRFIAEQHKPRKRVSVANRFQNNFRRSIRQPLPRSVLPISYTRSPTKTFAPRNHNNVNTPRNIPIHQRSQAPTTVYSFDQLQSKQTENTSGQSRVENGATNRVLASVNSGTNQSGRPILQSQANDLRNRINNRVDIDAANRTSTSVNFEMNKSSRPIQQNRTNDLRNRINNRVDNDATSRFSSSEMHQSSHQNQTSRPNQPNDLRNRINEIRNIPPSAYIDLTRNDSDESSSPRNKTTTNQRNDQLTTQSPPISPKSPKNVILPQQQNNTKQIPTPASTPMYGSTYNQLTPPILPSNPFFDIRLPPPPPNVQATKMQDRLKNPPKYDRKSVNDRLVQARLTLPVIDLTKESDLNRNVNESPVTQSYEKYLFDYCKTNGLSIPTFKLFGKNNSFQCYVTVDNVRYSTYPLSYETESEARYETAKDALTRLKALKAQKGYEVCLEDEVDLAIKIYECIKDCPAGIFLEKIEDKFQSSYKQSLPPDWMKAITKYPKCFTIEQFNKDKIVYIAETSDFVQKMDKIEYPWHEDYWCLYITHTRSTTEIWGKLIGKQHSTALDSLITDVEMELLRNKQVAKVVNIGQIYLVIENECVYRVRIEKVDNTEKQCLCFFVDEGDQRWIKMGEIYVCPISKFLKFPPQAIRFSLYGLEEFAEYEFATQHLEDTLIGKPLIGQIYTTRDDFILQEESDDLEQIIHVVLYDTSTKDDINLRAVLEEKICADIPTPELAHLQMTQVYVSHIDDAGNVFVQLKNGVHDVNKLIYKLTHQDGCSRLSTISSTNSSNKNLFLVIDEDTKKWCRGKLIREGNAGYTMFLIDYGKTTVVPLSKIYRLDAQSPALLAFPPQAIQIKLSGFDEFPANLVSTLRGHFSGDASASVMKMHLSSTIPEVNLYFSKDRNIVCVNDSLKMELDQVSDTVSIFSRQCSISSNTSRDSRIEERKVDSMVSKAALRKLTKFRSPEEGDYFEVEVVNAVAPSNFVIRPNKYMPQWTQQMRNLQEYCNNSREDMQLDMIKEGQPYACLHSDGLWYRAIVTVRRHSKIYVFFCDIGEVDNIDDVNKFKILPDTYRTLPKLAITARLYGIKPINSDWEMDDVIQFNRIACGKQFQAVVCKIITDNNSTDGNSILEIKLVDVSGDDDEYINDLFVKNGRASKTNI